MARNAETTLGNTLENMSSYCDGVYVVNDRSLDGTLAIARQFPVVQNVFNIDPGLSSVDWYIPEQLIVQLLYDMAEFYQPDWIIRLDADEYVERGSVLRSFLESLPSEIAGVRFPKVSDWADPDYPLMIPLMGAGRSMQGAIWRFFPGIKAEKKAHNARMPEMVARKGALRTNEDVVFHHSGWSNLQCRIDRVKLYQKLDPECLLNCGTPYDKGLLFGYSLNELDQLVHDYRERAAMMGNQRS